MRVLMLGWEFPPFIAGGLGTACFGLTKALAGPDLEITFVLPKHVDDAYAQHVRLISPQTTSAHDSHRAPAAVGSTYTVPAAPSPHGLRDPIAPGLGEAPALESSQAMEHVTFKAVPSLRTSPYPSAPAANGGGVGFLHAGQSGGTAEPAAPGMGNSTEATRQFFHHDAGAGYGGDLTAEANRYAALCLEIAQGLDFDVIHAHDWLTFPAGEALAHATGKPLIVHVHSTEFDRSGEAAHHELAAIEQRGVHVADRVIAVSHLTRRVLETKYGCPSTKITVVYNGIENGHSSPTPADAAQATESPAAPAPPPSRPEPKPILKDDKVVLFLGRITMQKGPEYFVRAAKRVLEKIEHVKFVMAGTGDKAREVIDLADELGIGDKLLFTGFLKGDDVSKVFEMADVYVMPSVSEPFGIAPLEAISHDVPVIISNTSGVSEVLQHVLKVDFWDIDEMANKIVAVLKYPPLGVTLRKHADLEVRRLTWTQAAEACRELYRSVTPEGCPKI